MQNVVPLEFVEEATIFCLFILKQTQRKDGTQKIDNNCNFSQYETVTCVYLFAIKIKCITW